MLKRLWAGRIVFVRAIPSRIRSFQSVHVRSSYARYSYVHDIYDNWRCYRTSCLWIWLYGGWFPKPVCNGQIVQKMSMNLSKMSFCARTNTKLRKIWRDIIVKLFFFKVNLLQFFFFRKLSAPKVYKTGV